jgi:hypothetical protein
MATRQVTKACTYSKRRETKRVDKLAFQDLFTPTKEIIQ